MNDEQILDYLNDLFRSASFVELIYSFFDLCFIIRGPKNVNGYGKTIQEAAENYKKKVENET